MINLIKAVSAAVQTIALVGKGVGKAQKVLSALTADKDADGTPEYKEAFAGILEVVHKFKDESIPYLKKVALEIKAHFQDYSDIVNKKVLPNIKSVFDAARQAALGD